MGLLTVIIPSGGPDECFFRKTIEDVLEKGVNVEVYAMTDGWVEPSDNRVKDDRVTYVALPESPHNHKREAVNLAISQCSGQYVMSLDCHCLVSDSFDRVLVRDHHDNWIQVPQRRRLDPFNWCEQEQFGKPHIGAEYWMWRDLIKSDLPGLHGYRWDALTLAMEAEGTLLFPTPTMQASCWFATKAWIADNDLFTSEGYTGWGAEAEALALGTAWIGGQLMSNSDGVFYAHWHKGSNGRRYKLNRGETHQSYRFAHNLWVKERHEFFISYLNRFPRMPNFPDNWAEIIREKAAAAPRLEGE